MALPIFGYNVMLCYVVLVFSVGCLVYCYWSGFEIVTSVGHEVEKISRLYAAS